MSQIQFREAMPKRSCTKTFNAYRSYKEYLANDFNSRCGYTDCHHRWFGGITTFHIDHFKPHKKFPALKTEYSNLVYACSYVNILKSDDDPANYLDPCTIDYNQHFYRDRTGRIFADPKSPRAIYMHKKLKLGLARYQVIWLLDKCNQTMGDLEALAEKLPSGSKEEIAVKNLYFELGKQFRAHLEFVAS